MKTYLNAKKKSKVVTKEVVESYMVFWCKNIALSLMALIVV